MSTFLRSSAATTLLLLLFVSALWASPSPTRTHDVGQLRLTVTEWGSFGVSTSGPSAEWPAGSGQEHLIEAGLWLGALESGVPRVTTSVGRRELRSVGGRGVFDQHDPDLGNARFPDPNFDDDGDGLEDEDPANGLDDDGDGAVDEDGGAIGDQHFRVTLTDDDPVIGAQLPDHDPLHVRVTVETYQWSQPGHDDFVGFDVTVENLRDEWLSYPRLGLFVDGGVGAARDPHRASDDLPGFWRGHVPLSDGSSVPVALAYVYDVDRDGGNAPGFFGVLLVTEAEDLWSIGNPFRGHRAHTFRYYDQAQPSALPTDDAARYAELARDWIAPPPALDDHDRRSDYALLLGTRDLPSLPPGVPRTVRGAFVVGAGEAELIENAARAVRACYGTWYDHDGDPSTGIRGRETQICEEDFGPPSPTNPIFRIFADCVDSTDILGPDPIRPIRPEDLDAEGCIYVDADCHFEEVRGFPECNDLEGLVPTQYFGCTGIEGREHPVRWRLPPTPIDETPVADLHAEVLDGGVHVWGTIENVPPETLRLRRLHAPEKPGHQWSYEEFTTADHPGRVDLVDAGVGAGFHVYFLERQFGLENERLGQTSIQLGPADVRDDLFFAAPLPARPQTVLYYRVDTASRVRIEIFDARGRRVRGLVSREREAGPQSVVWYGLDDRGRRVGSGVYFALLSIGNIRAVERLVMVR